MSSPGDQGQVALLLCFSLGFPVGEIRSRNPPNTRGGGDCCRPYRAQPQAVGNHDSVGGRRRRSLPAPRGAGARRTASSLRSWALRAQGLRRYRGVPPLLPERRRPSSHLPTPVRTHRPVPLLHSPVPPGRPWKPHPAGATSGPGMPHWLSIQGRGMSRL